MGAFKPLALAFLLSLISLNTQAEEPISYSALNSKIQNAVDTLRIKHQLPALSLSIKLPDKHGIRDYVSGSFSLSNAKRITPETLFQMGSITKSFTASIIFQLSEKEVLDLHDSLGKWLPQYPHWKDISIEELLHHTSGTPNYTSGKGFDRALRKYPYKYWSLNQLSKLAYKRPTLFKPGTQYDYSNTDYILLGLIIEKAAGKSVEFMFQDYIKEHQLQNSFFSPRKNSKFIQDHLAHGYNRDGTFNYNADVTLYSVSFTQTAGALISTPHDIVQWLNELFSEKIINHNSLSTMTSIVSPKDGQNISLNDIRPSKLKKLPKPFQELGIGAGLGLLYFSNGTLAWVHSGGTQGFESFYAYSPCNGVYLALAYSVKPKHQLTFIEIADVILKKINLSPEGSDAIRVYRLNNKLPEYCG